MSTVNVQIGLHELLNGSNAQIQLSVPQLVEKVLMRNEGKLTSTGAFLLQQENIQDVLLKINLL